MKFRMGTLTPEAYKGFASIAEALAGKRIPLPEEPTTGMEAPAPMQLNRMELPAPGQLPAATGMEMPKVAGQLRLEDQVVPSMPPLSPVQRRLREHMLATGQSSMLRSEAEPLVSQFQKEEGDLERARIGAEARTAGAETTAAGRTKVEELRQAGARDVAGGKNRTAELVARIHSGDTRYAADQGLAGRKYAADQGLAGVERRAEVAEQGIASREALASMADDTKRDISEAMQAHQLVVEKLRQAGKGLDRDAKATMFTQSLQLKYAALNQKADELEQQGRIAEAQATRQLVEAEVANDTRIFNTIQATPQGMRQTPEEQAAAVTGQRASNAARLRGARPALARPITRAPMASPTTGAPAPAPAKLSDRLQAKMVELGVKHPRYAELEAAYKNAVATGR